MWFLGRKSAPPAFSRFSYFEKFDYWAVFWGKEAHAHEAILAVTVLLFWYMYNIHLRPGKFPGSALWITGKITGKEISEEHLAEKTFITPGQNNLKILPVIINFISKVDDCYEYSCCNKYNDPLMNAQRN